VILMSSPIPLLAWSKLIGTATSSLDKPHDDDDDEMV